MTGDSDPMISNRVFWAGVVLASACIVSAGVAGQQQAGQQPNGTPPAEVVRTRRLEIVDKQGHVRAVLTTDDQDQPQFTYRDALGNSRPAPASPVSLVVGGLSASTPPAVTTSNAPQVQSARPAAPPRRRAGGRGDLPGLWWGTFGYSDGFFSATCTMKVRVRENGDFKGVFRMNTGFDTANADPDVLVPKDAGTVSGHIELQEGPGRQPPQSTIRLDYRPGVSSKGYTPDDTPFPAVFRFEDDRPDRLQGRWAQWGAHLNKLP